jgi:hypothetical protein
LNAAINEYVREEAAKSVTHIPRELIDRPRT